MVWLEAIALALLLAAISEYTAHRWLMHKPRGGHYFVEHAIDHHANGRNDVNIVLPISTNLIIAVPVAAACWLLGWQFAVAALLVAVLHALTWSRLHASFHDVGSQWMRRLPGWSMLYRHHVEHHRRPARNFGAVFGPCCDLLFGTRSICETK